MRKARAWRAGSNFAIWIQWNRLEQLLFPCSAPLWQMEPGFCFVWNIAVAPSAPRSTLAQNCRPGVYKMVAWKGINQLPSLFAFFSQRPASSHSTKIKIFSFYNFKFDLWRDNSIDILPPKNILFLVVVYSESFQKPGLNWYLCRPQCNAKTLGVTEHQILYWYDIYITIKWWVVTH